jgi:hypothetical protein
MPKEICPVLTGISTERNLREVYETSINELELLDNFFCDFFKGKVKEFGGK